MSGENIQQGAVVGAALEQAVVQQHNERLRGTEAINKEQNGCRKQGDGPYEMGTLLALGARPPVEILMRRAKRNIQQGAVV
jgi:hypothetical protein